MHEVSFQKGDHLWLWGTTYGATDGPGGPSMAAIHDPGGPSTCSNIFCHRWSGGTYFGGTICGMTGQSESGYDYNFVNPPPDRLVCKICQFPCFKTQLTDCCGHVHCQLCIEKVKTVADREHLCPMCGEANFKTIAHREADRTIKELLIYCPNNI